MGWRSIFIANRCKLSLQLSQLVLSNPEGQRVTLPLDDVGVIVLESREILISSALLSECAKYDIALFCCDESHMPNGIMLPFLQHCRYSGIVRMQVSWSEPFKKRVWQMVVKSKLEGQSVVLEHYGKSESKILRHCAKNVLSGDSDNREAYGASVYWTALFGASFRRKDENNPRNALLNYGYAIFRGAIARSLVGAGLLPALGVHHDNGLNPFNLADDLIEPFRPLVDTYVATLTPTTLLTPSVKQELVSLLGQTVPINGSNEWIQNAMIQSVTSLVKALETGETKNFHTITYHE